MRRKRQARMWRQVSKEQRKAANRVEQIVRTLATEAGVEPCISRTGRVTLRCTTCGKVCYREESDADKTVAQIPDPMMAYFSERCGWWHLATKR